MKNRKNEIKDRIRSLEILSVMQMNPDIVRKQRIEIQALKKELLVLETRDKKEETKSPPKESDWRFRL